MTGDSDKAEPLSSEALPIMFSLWESGRRRAWRESRGESSPRHHVSCSRQNQVELTGLLLGVLAH